MMPHVPPHGTVYKYFQKWERKGIWKQIHDQLRQKVRTQMGRTEKSRVAIADSQSVETTEKRGKSMASTAARRVKGRKRHIVVDSQGLLSGILVTEANAPERLGAAVVLHESGDELAQTEVIWVDQGYGGENFARVVKRSLWGTGCSD